MHEAVVLIEACEAALAAMTSQYNVTCAKFESKVNTAVSGVRNAVGTLLCVVDKRVDCAVKEYGSVNHEYEVCGLELGEVVMSLLSWQVSLDGAAAAAVGAISYCEDLLRVYDEMSDVMCVDMFECDIVGNMFELLYDLSIVVDHLSVGSECVCVGLGLTSFMLGDDERGCDGNRFELYVRDIDGGCVVGLSVDDVVVGIVDVDGVRSVGLVLSVVDAGAGEFGIVYVVDDDRVRELLIELSVCGELVNGSPFRVRLKGFDVLKVHYVVSCSCDCCIVYVVQCEWSRTITVKIPNHSNVGICVSLDEQLLAVSNYSANTISVYSLADGCAVRTIGDAGQFSACRICITPNNTILVADGGNKRVQV